MIPFLVVAFRPFCPCTTSPLVVCACVRACVCLFFISTDRVNRLTNEQTLFSALKKAGQQYLPEHIATGRSRALCYVYMCVCVCPPEETPSWTDLVLTTSAVVVVAVVLFRAGLEGGAVRPRWQALLGGRLRSEAHASGEGAARAAGRHKVKAMHSWLAAATLPDGGVFLHVCLHPD